MSIATSPMGNPPEQVRIIPVDEIVADDNIREPTEEAIAFTADSIARHGLLQHPRVRWCKKLNKWVIVVGHTRYLAVLKLGWLNLPCIPIHGEPSKADLLEQKIVENDHRTPLPPISRAKAVISLRDERGETSSQVAVRLGMLPSIVSDMEAWLTLPGEMQLALDDGRIGESVASWLARCGDHGVRRELFDQSVAKAIGRDAVKAAVQKSNGGARKYTKSEGKKAIKAGTIRIDPPEQDQYDEFRKLIARLARWAGESGGWDEFQGRVEK